VAYLVFRFAPELPKEGVTVERLPHAEQSPVCGFLVCVSWFVTVNCLVCECLCCYNLDHLERALNMGFGGAPCQNVARVLLLPLRLPRRAAHAAAPFVPAYAVPCFTPRRWHRRRCSGCVDGRMIGTIHHGGVGVGVGWEIPYSMQYRLN